MAERQIKRLQGSGSMQRCGLLWRQVVIDVGGRPGEANRGSDISAIHKTHHRQGMTGTGPATPHSGRIMWSVKPNMCCFHWSAVRTIIVSAWGSPIWYFCITLLTMWLLLLGTV